MCDYSRMRYTVRRTFGAAPEVYESTWLEFTTLLYASSRMPLKSTTRPDEKPVDLPFWFPVAMDQLDAKGSGCRRGNMHPEGLWALTYDYDGITPEQAQAVIKSARAFSDEGLVHTTWNHGIKPGVRMRVIMPLNVPCLLTVWELVWEQANRALGGLADPSCNNPERGYYVPAINLDAPEWARQVWIDHWGSGQ